MTGPGKLAAQWQQEHHAFTLTGFPGVSLVSKSSGAGSQIGADAKRIRPQRVRTVTLAAGQAAHALLAVADAGNFPAAKCHPVTARWLTITPVSPGS